MKTAALLAALALASCGLHAPPEWRGTPNPLDTPATGIVEPEANGHWGPFGTAPRSHRRISGSP